MTRDKGPQRPLVKIAVCVKGGTHPILALWNTVELIPHTHNGNYGEVCTSVPMTAVVWSRRFSSGGNRSMRAASTAWTVAGT